MSLTFPSSVVFSGGASNRWACHCHSTDGEEQVFVYSKSLSPPLVLTLGEKESLLRVCFLGELDNAHACLVLANGSVILVHLSSGKVDRQPRPFSSDAAASLGPFLAASLAGAPERPLLVLLDESGSLFTRRLWHPEEEVTRLLSMPRALLSREFFSAEVSPLPASLFSTHNSLIWLGSNDRFVDYYAVWDLSSSSMRICSVVSLDNDEGNDEEGRVMKLAMLRLHQESDQVYALCLSSRKDVDDIGASLFSILLLCSPNFSENGSQFLASERRSKSAAALANGGRGSACKSRTLPTQLSAHRVISSSPVSSGDESSHRYSLPSECLSAALSFQNRSDPREAHLDWSLYGFDRAMLMYSKAESDGSSVANMKIICFQLNSGDILQTISFAASPGSAALLCRWNESIFGSRSLARSAPIGYVSSVSDAIDATSSYSFTRIKLDLGGEQQRRRKRRRQRLRKIADLSGDMDYIFMQKEKDALSDKESVVQNDLLHSLDGLKRALFAPRRHAASLAMLATRPTPIEASLDESRLVQELRDCLLDEDDDNDDNRVDIASRDNEQAGIGGATVDLLSLSFAELDDFCQRHPVVALSQLQNAVFNDSEFLQRRNEDEEWLLSFFAPPSTRSGQRTVLLSSASIELLFTRKPYSLFPFFVRCAWNAGSPRIILALVRLCSATLEEKKENEPAPELLLQHYQHQQQADASPSTAADLIASAAAAVAMASRSVSTTAVFRQSSVSWQAIDALPVAASSCNGTKESIDQKEVRALLLFHDGHRADALLLLARNECWSLLLRFLEEMSQLLHHRRSVSEEHETAETEECSRSNLLQGQWREHDLQYASAIAQLQPHTLLSVVLSKAGASKEEKRLQVITELLKYEQAPGSLLNLLSRTLSRQSEQVVAVSTSAPDSLPVGLFKQALLEPTIN